LGVRFLVSLGDAEYDRGEHSALIEVHKRGTEGSPTVHRLGANVVLIIGAILAAALVTVVIVVFALPFSGRSTPIVPPTPASEGGEAAVDAAEVLARMRAAYASLETYRDTGHIIDHLASTDVRQRTRGSFSTVYRKPHSLAFCLKPLWGDKENERHWIVMDGGRFESRASEGPNGHFSRSEVFARLTEKSLGATRCVLPILIRVAELARVDDLQSPEYVGIGLMWGHACYKISGKQGSNSIVVWVDQRTSLIRAVEFDDARYLIIIHPEIETAIPIDAFTTPPTEVSRPAPSECSLCGEESADLRHRFWFVDVMLPAELQALCPACRGKERRKNMIFLGVLGLVIVVAAALIMHEVSKGP
jgi:hypothetical protein